MQVTDYLQTFFLVHKNTISPLVNGTSSSSHGVFSIIMLIITMEYILFQVFQVSSCLGARPAIRPDWNRPGIFLYRRSVEVELYIELVDVQLLYLYNIENCLKMSKFSKKNENTEESLVKGNFKNV